MAQPNVSNHNIKNPVKEGWLQKQIRHLRKWRPRWVVLEGSTLHTFKKEKDYANPTEIIDLKVFSSVKSSEDHTHKAFSFDVYSAELRFSFVATSENDKKDWITHIGKAIALSYNKSIEKLLSMGFDDKISFEAAKKFHGNIDKAIKYIIKSSLEIKNDIYECIIDDSDDVRQCGSINRILLLSNKYQQYLHNNKQPFMQ
eukprot:381818_1